jgi:hypothetical protein
VTHKSTRGFLASAGVLLNPLINTPSSSVSGAGISNAPQSTQDRIKTYAGGSSPTLRLKCRSTEQ